MKAENARVRDYVDVRPHPTVVRLQDLETGDAAWLSESFVVTPAVREHLAALTRVMARGQGAGAFLIGHYGAGKSHLLAWLAREVEAGRLVSPAPRVVPISLVNYGAENRLEEVVATALGLSLEGGDRRPVWSALFQGLAHGLLLLIDELSEFLRAKATPAAFTEDVRFLQFLGEWAQDRPLWIVAAMQEGIEHTGELEYGLYRKIKDRYPLRMLLTPAHVRSLIAEGILVKRPEYAAMVEGLARELREVYPDTALDYAALRAIYPLHPATLALLEEVRDRFSQSRGVVDFTVARLRGDPARGVPPFLDRPVGELLTPDAIVDHFRDLFEVQPEFLPLAQQLLPWYEHQLPDLFERPAQRALAGRILKLLVLTHLSPARDGLTAVEAATWLLVSISRVDPDRNRQIVERILNDLVERGRYVRLREGRYTLDLRDDSAATLERMLAREKASLAGREALVLETLAPLLEDDPFNPLLLPREVWQERVVLWSFHERRYGVWAGDAGPPPRDGLGLCVRLPWGQNGAVPGCFTVQPAAIPVGDELLELAALMRVADTPGHPELAERVGARIAKRTPLFRQALRAAYQEARIVSPDGREDRAPRLERDTRLDGWLETLALWALRRIYPGFERYAPSHGPLPREAFVRLMDYAGRADLGSAEADEYVRLIREAYLVPMGLMRRRGRDYPPAPGLERHDLVRLLTPLLEHSPSPERLHQHLAEPIYGLVSDQVNLLLIYLLLQGEIDILKDRRSYRETYTTLPNPLSYDRVVVAHALGMEQLGALERLCKGLGISTPAQWSALTQRRCAARLREAGERQARRLQGLLAQTRELTGGEALGERVQAHLGHWAALDKGQDPLQGLEQFLFELGPVAAFVEEARTLEALPERLSRLVAEARRYAHLLGHPLVQAYLERAAASSIRQAPGLEDPQLLAEWLQEAGRIYAGYRQQYAGAHQAWWQGVAGHPIWSWRPPPLAASEHLDLGSTLDELEGLRREALAHRCAGLVDLEYQAQCSCGFDGERAPLAPFLERFETLSAEVEARLRRFFAQDAVRARLRDWQREGLETTPGTGAYLQGQAPVPEVRDVATLDRYLAGAALSREMDLAPILELFGQRAWDPGELLAALERLLRQGGGQRLRFTGAPAAGPPEALLAWCAERCARDAASLPAELERGTREAIARALRPEWLGPEGIVRLGELGLGDEGEDRVLAWLLGGQVALPEAVAADPLVAAIQALRHPPEVSAPAALGELTDTAYRAHARLRRLAGPEWLAHLERLAETPLPDLPSLAELLQCQREAQWVLLDCLGLPLLPGLGGVLREAFGEWRWAEPEHARVAVPTTTDNCYRALLGIEPAPALTRIEVIDELIHQPPPSWFELIGVATTRLRGACGRLLPGLDPARRVVLFADHGFRLTADGRGYVHGGASTLERVVPVWRLEPR